MSDKKPADGEKGSSTGRTVAMVLIAIVLVYSGIIGAIGDQIGNLGAGIARGFANLFAVLNQNRTVALVIAAIIVFMSLRKKGGGDGHGDGN